MQVGKGDRIIELRGSSMVQESFARLIQRIAEGDPQAAEEIVSRHEQAIRVAVRTRLTDPRLRREFDSMDVCQSVLLSFFLRCSLGHFQLDEPAQLVALLTKMARNKLAMRVRASTRLRRQIDRRVEYDPVSELADPSPHAAEPLRHLVGRETLECARSMMTSEIRAIADLRLQKMSWQGVADHLGGTADARRKQFERALDEIADQLELIERMPKVDKEVR